MTNSKALAAALLAGCILVIPQHGLGQTTTTYTGEAAVVSVNALLVKTTVSDTGPLPASGGSLSTQLANLSLPGLLSANLLSATTNGGNNQVASQASLANVNLTVPGVTVTASVLTSNANAQACGNSQPSVSGGSTIAGLTLNGQSITITGAPNQTVPLLLGSLIINEQISSVTNSAAGSSANMLVNALHLKVAGVAEVVISSSRAGVSCTPQGGGCISPE